jgi:hypothetical protein
MAFPACRFVFPLPVTLRPERRCANPRHRAAVRTILGQILAIFTLSNSYNLILLELARATLMHFKSSAYGRAEFEPYPVMRAGRGASDGRVQLECRCE